MVGDTWKSDQVLTGINIKKRRNELQMTQEQLAEDMSMTKQAISDYECGHRNMGIQMLYDFADALDTTPDVLAPDRFKEKSMTEQKATENHEDSSGRRRAGAQDLPRVKKKTTDLNLGSELGSTLTDLDPATTVQLIQLADLVSKLDEDKRKAFFNSVEAMAIGYSVQSDRL